MSAEDTKWMSRAFELAESGLGVTSPNPAVGCVIVSGGEVLGEGYHQQFGGPHAERMALDAVKERAKGATLYVTLEPCNHVGKTPPCTAALLSSGIARVVYATPDPCDCYISSKINGFVALAGKGASASPAT